ncbi:MAG TPA: amidohydrolase family protein [Actinomycetota bacterium]|jgi:predicted TIM-barrel fold metal-dependent hydrolase|nr:amidohydrolase family protein [Actinomycetota bacterium]
MACQEEDPGLPIKLGPCSNAEYDPEPLPPVLRETIRRVRLASERHARRVGLSRRDFLLSTMGAAAMLLTLDACTRDRMRAVERRDPGGRYEIPSEAAEDPVTAEDAISGEEFIFDVQGHLLEYDLDPASRYEPFWGDGFPQANCGEEDPRACFSIEHFMQDIFVKSDTNMVALAGLPIAPRGSPLSPQIMEETRRVAEGLCQDERVVLHALALPNVGSLSANLEAMEEGVRRYPIAAWKVFTHYPDLYESSGRGWRLDDRDTGLPEVGTAFIRKAVELGVPRITVHKGLSGGSALASPVDVGPAAREHPDVDFIVYHSGFEAGTPEGPYTRQSAGVGVNRLITSLKRSSIRSGRNVYAEIGSTWWYIMRFPDQAAHLIGKLLKYLGEDNILWGTDSIWYGSPQDQIQAFRAFRITEEFQDRYGYPALSKGAKRKILGLNATRLYAIDPVIVPCRFTRRELMRIRRQLRRGNRTNGPRTPAEARTVRDHHRGLP